MNVDPQAFVMKMADRWQNSIGGVVTTPLTQVWKQQAEIFNSKINGEYSGKWVVLQPPTGSGKSRGLETYCSMLPTDNHPGVMIVVRMIEDADAMVETINQLSENDDMAIARHTENDVDLDDVSVFPVLVVTHAAYQLAVESPEYWSGLMSWRTGRRKLVVIDESLNVIEQTQVDFDQLRELRGVIPEWLQQQFPDDCARLDAVIAVMEKIKSSHKATGKAILPGEWELTGSFTFSKLSRAIGAVDFDETILKKADDSERQNLLKKYRDMMRDVDNLVQKPCWYQKKGLFHLFTLGRITVPQYRMDAVVMDATASCNPLYSLLGDYVALIDPPENVRNYGNVNLYVSFGHKIGKVEMSKNPQEDGNMFMASMADEIPKEGRLFICTHKAVEPHLIGYDEQFPGYSVSHWGAVDGKNDWNDCATAIMYGLQYLDGIVPETTIQAVEDWRKTDFTLDEREKFLRQIEVGHQVVTLVQAINRVRCRHVTDENGGCHPTNIYLLMPDKARSREILAPLVEQMPGIVPRPWTAKAPRRKVKRSKYEPVLVKFLAGLCRGSHPAQKIREELDIPETSFDRLLAKALDESNALYRELLEIGASFHRHGEGSGGRGNFSWFEKIA